MIKNEFFILIVFVFIFTIVIVINVCIYKWIVRRAFKQYIKPYLMNKGYTIQEHKYPGIFSSGAFKNEFLFGAFVMGWPYHYTYVDIYSINKSGSKLKTTAQISTLFLSIRKVTYKDYSD